MNGGDLGSAIALRSRSQSALPPVCSLSRVICSSPGTEVISGSSGSEHAHYFTEPIRTS
jgi:hypothetical protein